MTALDERGARYAVKDLTALISLIRASIGVIQLHPLSRGPVRQGRGAGRGGACEYGPGRDLGVGMSGADKLTLIILAGLVTVALLAMIRLPVALILSALAWYAVWKVGAL